MGDFILYAVLYGGGVATCRFAGLYQYGGKRESHTAILGSLPLRSHNNRSMPYGADA